MTRDAAADGEITASPYIALLKANDELISAQLKATEAAAHQVFKLRSQVEALTTQLHNAELKAQNASLSSVPVLVAAPPCDHSDLEATLKEREATIASQLQQITQLTAERDLARREVIEVTERAAASSAMWEDERRIALSDLDKYQARLEARDREAAQLTANLDAAEAELTRLRADGMRPDLHVPPPRPLTRDVSCAAETVEPQQPAAAQLSPRHATCVARADHDAEVQELRQEVELLRKRLDRVARDPSSAGAAATGPNGETVADYARIVAELQAELANTTRHLEGATQRNKTLLQGKSTDVAHLAAAHAARNDPGPAATHTGASSRLGVPTPGASASHRTAVPTAGASSRGAVQRPSTTAGLSHRR